MGDPKPSYLASPSKPKLKLPAGACDAHVHVFGPSAIFPFADNRPFTLADAPKEKLFALHIPDDGVLVDLVSEIAPSEKERRALLVDNPRRFYGFRK
jgi:predicted TIM-barrel fold metal-dependent hydrolase